MKCSKCKKKFDKDTKFCTNCGNKVNNPAILLKVFLAVLLYFIASIVFILALAAFFENNGIMSGFLFLACAISICPINYSSKFKYLNFLNITSVRVVIILITFVFGIISYPLNDTLVNGNDEKILIEDIEKTQNDDKVKQEQEDFEKKQEEKTRQEEEKTRQEEEKRKQEEKTRQEEEKRKQEEKIRQEEEKRKQEEKIRQEEKAERIRNGETELNNGKFTLQAGHKGYYDGFSYYITGELLNNTSKIYSYVQIEFNVYDSSGSQIGSALANVNNLEANGTWKFKAISLGSSDENIASYKVIDVTAF